MQLIGLVCVLLDKLHTNILPDIEKILSDAILIYNLSFKENI